VLPCGASPFLYRKQKKKDNIFYKDGIFKPAKIKSS